MAIGIISYFALAALVAIATAAPLQPDFIDLSYSLNNETINWPGSPRFRHEKVFVGMKSFGYYTLYDIVGSEHSGTHIDAPIHFAANKWTTEEIPLSSLIGDAVVVNFSVEAAKNRDAQLMPSHLEAWEREHGRIPEDAILLLYTGWGKFWSDKKNFLGTLSNESKLLHFPGMHPSAAQWLVDKRKVKLFGLDTASVDFGQSTTFRTHQILSEKNIPGLENLANLDKLPTKGAVIYALPMKLTDGSGAPCRVIATIKKNKRESYSGAGMSCGSALPFVLAVLSYLYFWRN